MKRDVSALKELRDKVEAGDAFPADFICLMPDDPSFAWKSARAYYGSLDAAKALHDAVLPGWLWGRMNSGVFWVGPGLESGRFYGMRHDPARSWLLAIISALIAKETQ